MLFFEYLRTTWHFRVQHRVDESLLKRMVQVDESGVRSYAIDQCV
jgi:hypothetical protein